MFTRLHLSFDESRWLGYTIRTFGYTPSIRFLSKKEMSNG